VIDELPDADASLEIAVRARRNRGRPHRHAHRLERTRDPHPLVARLELRPTSAWERDAHVAVAEPFVADVDDDRASSSGRRGLADAGRDLGRGRVDERVLAHLVMVPPGRGAVEGPVASTGSTPRDDVSGR
jgi:hypothetical protein